MTTITSSTYHQPKPMIECLVQDPKFLPRRAHNDDAGADLLCTETCEIAPGEKRMLDTGVAVKIPRGWGGFVFNRSSQGKIEVQLTNGVGVIDAAYRGNIKVILKNNGDDVYRIERGETRIAQLAIIPVLLAEFVDIWNDTERGTGGFGSTGT